MSLDSSDKPTCPPRRPTLGDLIPRSALSEAVSADGGQPSGNKLREGGEAPRPTKSDIVRQSPTLSDSVRQSPTPGQQPSGNELREGAPLASPSSAKLIPASAPLASPGAPTPWVYLFTRRAKLDQVNALLSEQFPTFIHRSVVYERAPHSVTKTERPTIAGLIFVQGTPRDVQLLLDERFIGLWLVRDYATGQTARISDAEMQGFMRISRASATHEVRFLLNPLEHYAEGHHLVRITSGDLAGCEGYIVRIARDRRLVTRIGCMTVAIGGVWKESIENAEEYVAARLRQLPAPREADLVELTPLQREIHTALYTPRDDLDAMALTKSLDLWLQRARSAKVEGNLEAAQAISLAVLHEIAARFKPRHFGNATVGIAPTARDFLQFVPPPLPRQPNPLISPAGRLVGVRAPPRARRSKNASRRVSR